jgi:DNA-directed RNA polymerase subunit K/omega
MELETPVQDPQEEPTTAPEPIEPAPPVSNRFLFVDIAALRAKQLRRGARPRLDPTAHDTHPQPHKAERVAMEEVRKRLVQFDLPPAKPPVANTETGL